MSVQTPEATDTSKAVDETTGAAPDAKQTVNMGANGNSASSAPTAGDTTTIADTGSTPAAPSPVVVQPRHPMPFHFPELRHHDPVLAPVPEPVVTPAAPEDPHSVHDASKGYQPERNVCVRCGSTNLARGYVVDYGEKFRQVHFAPRRITLGRLNSLLNLMPFRSLAKLDAVACRDCGAVLLTVDPAELRRAEHRRE